MKTGTPSDMLLEETQEAQGAFKNLMTHWSCDSHYVSHFAAFFIVVGAKTSVAESVMDILVNKLTVNHNQFY